MVLLILLLTVGLAGCGETSGETTKVVLTTGFEEGEIFRIEDISCYLPEMMVYLTNMQDQYENVYGEQIWSVAVGDASLEDNVKDNALARMAQVKTMNLMARDMGIELSEKEHELVDEATELYYTSLSYREVEAMGADRELIRHLYGEYLLAQKVYEEIIKDINPEVSDDEARTIKVQHILIKTYALDGTGNRIDYTENAKRTAFHIANEALDRARADEDFDELIRTYSEAETSTISFRKGELDPAFEEASFQLGTGEISDLVETEFGYEIIKCLSTFDMEETDSNKIAIVEEKREQVFEEQYDSYVQGLTRILNEKLWDQVEFIRDENVTTESFFSVIDELGR